MYGQSLGSGVHGVTTSAQIGSVGVRGEGARGGVYGFSSAGGWGVQGRAEGSGTTIGVMGHALSTTGRGVYGFAGAASGTTYGVFGLTASPAGRGVYGSAVATSGTTYGVRGDSASPLGRGVHGYATAKQGVNYGVVGTTSSSVGYGVFSSGRFAASGTKSFVQPHPKDPSKAVEFVCLEGNESGTYFRGTSRLRGKRAVLEIPESWQLVTAEEGITVQLTPLRSLARLAVLEQSRTRIVVIGDADCEFHYFVNGVRRGYTEHRAIIDNHAYVPRVRGVAFGSQYPEAIRRILVANGILNADFTPNEATARRLGWELREPAAADDDLPISEPRKAANAEGGR